MRVVVALAALAAAGCEGGGDPVQQALREEATANHAAVAKATPLDPASVQARDIAVAVRMIEAETHAMAAAEAALAEVGDPEIRRLAEAARQAHRSRIAQLEAWRAGR